MSEQKFYAFDFDASKVAPAQPLEPVPAGWYPAKIIETEIKPTESGTGLRMPVTFEIIDGPFKGRLAFDGFNVKNDSEKSQAIGQSQASAVCHATGVYKFKDVRELIGKPFALKLKLEGESQDKETGKNYEAKNRFSAAKPIGELASGGAPASGASAQAATGFQPNWAINPNQQSPAVQGTPSQPPAAPAGPSSPPPPPAAVPSAPSKPDRAFFVFIAHGNMPKKTEAEVIGMLAAGLPPATLLNEFAVKDEWKPASAFNLALQPPTAPAGSPPPPWN